LRLSLTSRLIASLGNQRGRVRGALVTGLVYSLGGRFFTRRFYREQGKLAEKEGQPQLWISLSFDVDYAEDVSSLGEVCNILQELGVTASFAVVGCLVEKYPDEHRILSQAGHEIINHTYSHPDNEILHPNERFDDLSPEDQKNQIKRCHLVLEDLLGVSPQGFRAPHFGNVRDRRFYQTLAELGYSYSSSIISVDSPGFGLPFKTEEGIWEFPVSCCPVHPFTALDTWHALRKPKARHKKAGEFASLVTESVALVKLYGGYLNLYLDPRDVAGYDEARKAIQALKAPGPDLPGIITFSSHLELLQKGQVCNS